MPDVTTNISTLSKGVTDLARDAAYVAVGLGVLGYQRAQVQRVELQNRLSAGPLAGPAHRRGAPGRGQGRSSRSTTWPRRPRSSSRPPCSRSRRSCPRRSPS